ncbi:MAG: hypothetical protein IPK13_20685 [Deltaproteobacteria bacterium]|nr:hypothetical protein [Deltaproteobacteria bacterium]
MSVRRGKERARVLSPAISTLGFVVLYAFLCRPFCGLGEGSRGAARSSMGGIEGAPGYRMEAASTASSLDGAGEWRRGHRVRAQISSIESLSLSRPHHAKRRALPKTEAELLRLLRAERAIVFDASEVEVVRTPERNFSDEEGGRIILRRASVRSP